MFDQIDEDRWLTYAEAGEFLGISAEAARVRARRHKWPRRTPNERGAVARVLVPVDVLGTDRLRPPTTLGRPPDDRRTEEARPLGQTVPDRADTTRTIVEIVETLMEPIREQLAVANRRTDEERSRADRAEKQADEERTRADQERDRADRERDRAAAAEKRITELQTPPAAAEPPRTGWNRFLAWWKEH